MEQPLPAEWDGRIQALLQERQVVRVSALAEVIDDGHREQLREAGIEVVLAGALETVDG